MVEEKLHKQQWLKVARWAAGWNPALLAALALRAACCCVCPVGAGLGAMLWHWGYAGFLIFPCLCVTAVCYHICDVVPSGGLSTAQEEQC